MPLPHIQVSLREDIFEALLLVISECSGHISNDPVVLHKNTTKASSRGIAIDIKRLGIIWLS
jgi:hypothetical protein